MPSFQELFGRDPQAIAEVPGRVNVLGEHTDYNDGYVLPTVIPQTTTVQVGLSADGVHHLYSATLQEQVDLPPQTKKGQGFSRYVLGCFKLLEAQQILLPALNLWIDSTIPIGAGLSSSAALNIAVLKALRSLLSLDITDLDLAKLAQQVEHQYAGVQCGIMDPIAVCFADRQHLLFLDTQTLDFQRVPFPEGAELLVMDSGIPRTLANSGYNQRRAECEEAAQELGLPSLRAVRTLDQLRTLRSRLRARARHVFTENQRVLTAKDGVSARELGLLMNASHASLRDDYQVSVPGVDDLVELLINTPGVFGARLTGAGFGGACVALIAQGQAAAIAESVLTPYRLRGYTGRLLVPNRFRT